MKKSLKKLLLGTSLIAGLTLGNIFNADAQTKPFKYINPFEHKDNPTWNSADSSQKISILENQVFPKDSIWFYAPGNWICGDYANQTMIDYNGYGELDTLNLKNFSKFVKNNGKFKIPTFRANTTSQAGAHTINAILVGDDVRNFNDWYFFEPQFNTSFKKVQPGDWSMTLNSFANMDHITHWENYFDMGDTLVGCYSSPDFVKFKLTNGKDSLADYNNSYVVLKNPRLDSIAPTINTTLINNDLKIEISDSSFLDEYAYYKIDSQPFDTIHTTREKTTGRLPLYNKTESIPLSLSPGNHSVQIQAKDIAGNLRDTTFNFVITGTKDLFQNYSVSNPYPNPTNSNTTFEYSIPNNEKVSLRLSDPLGKTLETISQQGENKFTIDMSKYSNGMYYSTITTESGYNKSGKVVKK